jgi:ATPase subunit of ABC transporter with duplicated ATPase domains
MAQEHQTLDLESSVLDTLMRVRPMSEQDARSFLPYFLFYGDAVFTHVKACSLGERAVFAAVVVSLDSGCTRLSRSR